MNSFLGKLIPFFAGISSVSLMAAGTPEDSYLIWVFRTFISLAVAIIAYFVKGMIDDNKESNRKRDGNIGDLIKITAAHEVMYKYWLETLINEGHPNDGRRKTDELHNVIKRLSEIPR